MIDIKKHIKCGLVMPISAATSIDATYTKQHWEEVKEMFMRTCGLVDAYDIECSLVSNADESHVVHSTIIRNILNMDIIICDVSSKNPNVMFELGLRIAFGKPVIVVKDDTTQYSFDTTSINHLVYKTEMSYASVDDFQVRLKDSIVSTYEGSIEDGYTPLITQMSGFTVSSPLRGGKAESNFSEIALKLDQVLFELSEIKVRNIQQGMNRDALIDAFIISYIEKNNISQNHVISSINAIVKAVAADSQLRVLFNNSDELEKVVANTIIKSL